MMKFRVFRFCRFGRAPVGHTLLANLNVVYPPLYQHLIWDCKKANVDGIRKSLNSINWGFVLSDKNVHQQVQYLNEILKNVFLTIYQING